MENLINNVEQWAEDRNIIQGSEPDKQFLKLVEELGELAEGVSERNLVKTFDGTGDVIVVAIILAKQFDVKLNFRPEINVQKSQPDALFPNSTRRYLALAVASVGAIGGLLARRNPKPESIGALLSLLIEHLVRLTAQLGTTIEACLEIAWGEIKHRKGRMVDGVFVKEEDLPPSLPAGEVVEESVVEEPKPKKGKKNATPKGE